MAVTVKRTGNLASNGVKGLVYGQSGAGKTTLMATLPSPIILSAESGLLSLEEYDLPYIEIRNMDDLREAYTWLTDSDEAKEYQSVGLDSISEVAEVVLAYELKTNKDGRAAYGEMNSTMSELIRAFRDLPNRNVYFTAKLEKSQDEMGKMLYNPSMPGKSLTQQLPYFFDLCLALRVERDGEGNVYRALMTESDGTWLAKARGTRLDPWEEPDLGKIITKLGGRKSDD